MKRILTYALLAMLFARLGSAQDPSVKLILSCDEHHPCSHRYDNGELLKTITDAGGVSITAALEESKNGKYFRLRLGIANDSQRTFDVTPDAFLLDILGHKAKVVKPVPPEEMERAAERSAFWANYLSMLGAHMARDTIRTTSTTNSHSSGNVRVNSPDGFSGSATYTGNGTSVTNSTTSIPDYAARADAAQAARQRNELVAAQNAVIAQTALRDNTLSPGQAVGGFVYFKSGTADSLRARILVDGTEYDFEF